MKLGDVVDGDAGDENIEFGSVVVGSAIRGEENTDWAPDLGEINQFHMLHTEFTLNIIADLKSFLYLFKV